MVETLGITIDRRLKGRPRKMEAKPQKKQDVVSVNFSGVVRRKNIIY